MPKRVSKNKAKPQADRAREAPAASPADVESEFSVPQKWQENEQENASASTGPESAARDGERTEEAADTRAS